MTKSSYFAQGNNDPLANEITQAQLECILSSSLFIASPSLSQILQFVVTETLSGRAAQIKAYTIAIKACGGASATLIPRPTPLCAFRRAGCGGQMLASLHEAGLPDMA